MEVAEIALFSVLYVVATAEFVLLFVLGSDDPIIGEDERNVVVRVGPTDRQQWSLNGTTLTGQVTFPYQEWGSSVSVDNLGVSRNVRADQVECLAFASSGNFSLVQGLEKMVITDSSIGFVGDWTVSGEVTTGVRVPTVSVTGNVIESTASSGGFVMGSTNGSNDGDVTVVLGSASKLVAKDLGFSELNGEWSVGQLETGPIQTSAGVTMVDDLSGLTNNGIVVGTGVTGTFDNGSVNVGQVTNLVNPGTKSVQIGQVFGSSVDSICVSSFPMSNLFAECVTLSAQADVTETKLTQVCYINPIRAVEDNTTVALCYDDKEVVQSANVHLTANAITSSASSGGLEMGTSVSGDVSLVQGGVSKLLASGDLDGDWVCSGDSSVFGVCRQPGRIEVTSSGAPSFNNSGVVLGRTIGGSANTNSVLVGHDITNGGTNTIAAGRNVSAPNLAGVVLNSSDDVTTLSQNNCIVVSADGSVDTKQQLACYIRPIREKTDPSFLPLMYNPNTHEVTQGENPYQPLVMLVGNSTLQNYQATYDGGVTYRGVSNVPNQGVDDIYYTRRGMWVTVGDGTTYTGAYSYNGIIWGRSPKVTMTTCLRVCESSGMIVRGGSGGGANFEMSSDGQNFEEISTFRSVSPVKAMTGDMFDGNSTVLIYAISAGSNDELGALDIFTALVSTIPIPVSTNIISTATHDSLPNGSGKFLVIGVTDTNPAQLLFTPDWTTVTSGSWSSVDLSGPFVNFVTYLTYSNGQHIYVAGLTESVVCRFSYPSEQVDVITAVDPDVDFLSAVWFEGSVLFGVTNVENKVYVSTNFLGPALDVVIQSHSNFSDMVGARIMAGFTTVPE